MFQTGLVNIISTKMLKLTGTSERGVIIGVLIVSAILSTISSNTAVVLALIPLVQGLCKKANMSTSKVMYPLSVGCAFGGAVTLIGTTSNVAGNQVLNDFELPIMGFFSIAWVGIPLTIAGFIWMLTFGIKLLPKKSGYDGDGQYSASGEDEKVRSKPKLIITSVIIIITLVIMIAKPNLLSVTSFIAAIVLILTGCISEKAAIASLDMRLFLIVAGFTCITQSITSSGGGKIIGDWVISVIGEQGNPYVVTSVIFLVSVLMTAFLNNTGTVLLMGPIAVHIANSIGVNPVTLVIIVVIAANACFATPVGAPAFTLVLGPGHYKFKDYVRMGLPLIAINFIVAVIVIPLVWRF
jgi:anion transporter